MNQIDNSEKRNVVYESNIIKKMMTIVIQLLNISTVEAMELNLFLLLLLKISVCKHTTILIF